jgi:hypothetical protein
LSVRQGVNYFKEVYKLTVLSDKNKLLRTDPVIFFSEKSKIYGK